MLTFGGPPPLAIDQSRATTARAELRVEVARAVADRSADGGGPRAETDRAAVQAATKAADAADAKVTADQAAYARGVRVTV